MEFTVGATRGFWKGGVRNAKGVCEQNGAQVCSMKQSDWPRRLEKLYQNLNGT